MKASLSLTPELLENADQFTGEFYRRFTLRHAPNPLRLTDTISKDYLFPTFYGDVTTAMAVFLCDYARAKALLPHPRLEPVRMPRGRALVALVGYEYQKVLGVAPYNEIAMTIPILVDPPLSPPVAPMLVPGFPGFGYWVFSMPVTSLENQLRGVRIWGLPKVVQEIDIRREGDESVTVAHDESGAPYFELRVPVRGKPTPFDVSSYLYTRLGDELKQSETCFQTTFAVNKHPEVLVRRGLAAERPCLRILGDSPMAATLRSLAIEEVPLETRYAEGMTSCFDLPRPGFAPPFDFRGAPAEPAPEPSLLTRARAEVDAISSALKQRRARRDLNVVVYGSGVIGSTVGAWLAPHYDRLTLVDRPAVVESLRQTGLRAYPLGGEAAAATVHPRLATRLDDGPPPDVILLAVKNYHLDAAARAIREQVGDRPIVVGMQNGVENRQILPRHFSKVLYGVVSFNAWTDGPGRFGYQKKGPLVIGAPDAMLRPQAADLARILDLGVPTLLTDHIEDAAHSKLVINLANSLTTLIGHMQQEISDRDLFQKLLSGLAWEGVEIVKAAGYAECKLGGMPSWKVIWAAAHLPTAITRPLFERNVQKMVISSMAQDVLQRRSPDTELDTLNGYLLGLADRHHVAAPINRTVYDLCKREFARPDFTPMDVRDVWAAVEKRAAGDGGR
jgi:2-dehydropantoate 2-reductase